MKPPLSLIIVHGDGSRVLRLSVPRWLAYGTLGCIATAAAMILGVSGDYARLERQAWELVRLRQRADDQRVQIDAFDSRLAALRGEIAGWKSLHARMWQAFGSDPGTVPADAAATAGVGRDAGGAELDLLARDVAEESPRLRDLEQLISRNGEMVRALPLRWPLEGPVKSGYGHRRSPWDGSPEWHRGIDIGSPPGTPIKSPAPGKVVVASAYGGLGKHVALDHGNGVRSLYGHMKEIDVKVGERVEKGQVIGLVGSTGRSTGPHLHYELLVAGSPVDPRGFLLEH